VGAGSTLALRFWRGRRQRGGSASSGCLCGSASWHRASFVSNRTRREAQVRRASSVSHDMNATELFGRAAKHLGAPAPGAMWLQLSGTMDGAAVLCSGRSVTGLGGGHGPCGAQTLRPGNGYLLASRSCRGEETEAQLRAVLLSPSPLREDAGRGAPERSSVCSFSGESPSDPFRTARAILLSSGDAMWCPFGLQGG